MGVKAAVLAGLLLPLLLLLFFISPLVEGVYQCSDLTKSDFMSTVNCEVGQEKYCFAVKCKKEKEDGKAEAYGCGGIATRLDACEALDKEYCSDKEGIKKGPEGCQLCTGEKCNTGELEDGGDWDNPDHKPVLTTTLEPTTTTKLTPPTTTKKTGRVTIKPKIGTRPAAIATTIKKTNANETKTTTMKVSPGKGTNKGSTKGPEKVTGDEHPEDEGDNGHFATVNWLLLIVASLLIGLIS